MIGPRASAAVRSCIASAASVRRMSKAVVFSDPRLVFDPSEREQAARARKPGEPRCCVQLTLSDAAAAQLAEPQYHPADTSEPGNSWVVGEQKEVFEYEAFGSLSTRSGFVCAVEEQSWNAKERPAEFANWDDFMSKYGKELESTQPLTSATHPEISPLLFVGKIMAADSATVYGDEAEDQKEVHQIAIMSNSAS